MSAVYFIATVGEYRLRFQYDAAVVALIKRTVPGHARSWSAQARVWTVQRDWASILAAELCRHGHSVAGIESPPLRQQQHHNGENWAETLFDRVGPTRKTAVYRALSRVLHPDTETGDHILQLELNNAYNHIETRSRSYWAIR